MEKLKNFVIREITKSISLCKVLRITVLVHLWGSGYWLLWVNHNIFHVDIHFWLVFGWTEEVVKSLEWFDFALFKFQLAQIDRLIGSKNVVWKFKWKIKTHEREIGKICSLTWCIAMVIIRRSSIDILVWSFLAAVVIGIHSLSLIWSLEEFRLAYIVNGDL